MTSESTRADCMIQMFDAKPSKIDIGKHSEGGIRRGVAAIVGPAFRILGTLCQLLHHRVLYTGFHLRVARHIFHGLNVKVHVLLIALAMYLRSYTVVPRAMSSDVQPSSPLGYLSIDIL